jgi:hypothetical protein
MLDIESDSLAGAFADLYRAMEKNPFGPETSFETTNEVYLYDEDGTKVDEDQVNTACCIALDAVSEERNA